MAELRDEALVAVTEADDGTNAIAQDQLPHEPLDHVVLPRAEPSARDDAAAGLRGVEVDPVTGPRQLEGGNLLPRGGVSEQGREALVDRHPIGFSYEVQGLLPEQRRDGGFEAASAQDGDRGIG